ncbi:DUF3833 domain-containing protein [Shewanella holmiensis]|uniref:DUF3833 domain-containing protein n=1 Tax=Shewanella holmiensis TaxID=2952222 RepID=A0A9X2WKF6_9GAMM|nr:DUF3833 domain-containing protein [Shewanella holmiensis]MCT7941032.1 DUF3833 domain-containing protein [Shewanella holmiensis]
MRILLKSASSATRYSASRLWHVKWLKKLAVIAACISLFSCSSASIEDYTNSNPTLNLAAFFDGELTASGIVQDYSGKVTRKFTVTMTGSWQGNKGELKEWFIYDDGEKQTRIWYLTDLGNGQFEGRADDILGIAKGEANGSALRWRYDMKLLVDGSEYEVEFDDWMFLVDNKTIINKSDINKFGIKVAEVTLVIQRK